MSEKTTKTKRKNILNLIDVFLIILIVLVLGALLSYRFLVGGEEEKSVYLEYSVDIMEVSENVNVAKLTNDQLYDRNDIYMGKVISCSEVQTATHRVASNEKVFSEETVNYITVTIGCEAVRMKDGGYRINGKELNPGDALTLISDDFKMQGKCISITEVKK